MRLRASIALLLSVSACATSTPSPREPVVDDPRLANLQRAAKLPWTDGGQCAVREAAQPWPVLVRQCYPALDQDRVEFHDLTGKCSVAAVGAVPLGLGLCVLAAPQVVVGAVVVVGVVVVGFAIHEALEAYELRRQPPLVGPVPETFPVPVAKPAPQKQFQKEKRPQQEPKELDFSPLGLTEAAERERRRRCEPIPVPHAGKDDAHNRCADQFPPNRYPGMDVLVDGVSFDALQVGVPVLWEIKTHRFDTYNALVRRQEIEKEYTQIKKERAAAVACGYGYVIGVSTQAHKDALLQRDRFLNIAVTGCKR